jgi:hypothetical protein
MPGPFIKLKISFGTYAHDRYPFVFLLLFSPLHFILTCLKHISKKIFLADRDSNPGRQLPDPTPLPHDGWLKAKAA